MSQVQIIGLRVDSSYLSPFVSFVEVDPKINSKTAQSVRAVCNTPLVQALKSLAEKGWVVTPANIPNYIPLSRTVETKSKNTKSAP